jgi:hypothetical protein
MPATKSPIKTERILRPVQAMAITVTTLTAAIVAAIIFTHLAHSKSCPASPPGRVNLPSAFSSNAQPARGPPDPHVPYEPFAMQ